MKVIVKIVAIAWIFVMISNASGHCLGSQYGHSFRSNLQIIIDRNPSYLWGGSTTEEQGLDCSGYIFLAARRAGLPVKRTTAVVMEKGLQGWIGNWVKLEECEELDLVWWTWKTSPARIHGHVGVLLINRRSGLLEVTHSSSKKGVIIQPMNGTLLRDMSSLKRLSIGDKR